jgi:polysaccharide export outer membrane protein
VRCDGPPQSTLPPQQPYTLPRELTKASLPDYVIEPPDILVINAQKVVPLPTAKLEPLDSVVITAKAPLPNEPLSGEYVIEPNGRVNLGPKYGTVALAGLTVDEAKAAVEKQLGELLGDPTVYFAPSRMRVPQQIIGEHLVRPDGKVSLGSYGFVYVTGMTVVQARQAIEAHLSQYLQTPEVSVDVAAYNSKIIYVISDGGGAGQTVLRLPVTGNETVLDAVAQTGGLSPVASQRRIWVARPAPSPAKGVQILPVDWVGITTEARTDTNYQLFPGDRLFIQSQPLVKADTAMARVFAPFERVFGFSLLGTGLYRGFRTLNSATGTGGGF